MDPSIGQVSQVDTSRYNVLNFIRVVYIIVKKNWIRIHFEREIRIRTRSEENTLNLDPVTQSFIVVTSLRFRLLKTDSRPNSI